MKTATLVERQIIDMKTHPGRPLLVRWIIQLHGRCQRLVDLIAVADRKMPREQWPSITIGTRFRFARRSDSGSTKQRMSRAMITEDRTIGGTDA